MENNYPKTELELIKKYGELNKGDGMLFTNFLWRHRVPDFNKYLQKDASKLKIESESFLKNVKEFPELYGATKGNVEKIIESCENVLTGNVLQSKSS